MKRVYYSIIFVFILSISCYYSPSGAKEGNKEDGYTTPEVTTVKWEPDDDYIEFYTNDISMLKPNGSSYWKPRKYTGLVDDVVEVNVCKTSGMTGYGYGLIFCIQDEPVGEDFAAKNFYCVLIRVDGFYQIIKAVWDGDPDHAPVQHILKISGSDAAGWKEALDTESNNVLNMGKGVENKIKVEITDSENNNRPDFAIYFNDYKIEDFEDNFLDDEGTELPQFFKDAGLYKYGFIVTLAPDESFPYVPVDVMFNQTTPVY